MVATFTDVIIKYLSYKLKLLGVVPLKNTLLLFQEIVLPNIWQNSRGVLLETSASATAQKPLREKSGRSTYRSCLLKGTTLCLVYSYRQTDREKTTKKKNRKKQKKVIGEIVALR